VAAKEVELDDVDMEILEHVFDEDMIDSLCEEFEQEQVKLLMEKLEVEFPEDVFPSEED